MALFVLASDIVFLLFAAVLLAILLRAASDALGERTGLGPGWSLGLVAVTLAAVLAAATYSIGSMAVTQFNQLAADLPRSTDQARAYVRQYPWGDAAFQRMPAAGDLFDRSVRRLRCSRDQMTQALVELVRHKAAGIETRDPDIYQWDDLEQKAISCG